MQLYYTYRSGLYSVDTDVDVLKWMSVCLLNDSWLRATTNDANSSLTRLQWKYVSNGSYLKH